MTGPRAPRPSPPVVVGPWAGLSPRGRRTLSWNPGLESGWFDESILLLELAQARRPGLARFVAPRAAYMAVTLAVLFGIAVTAFHWDKPEIYPGATVTLAVFMWTVWTAGWVWVLRNHTLYAGAERLADGEGKDKVVGLYDLVTVTLHGHGAQARLCLVGTNDVHLNLPMGLVEGNPALWRLVYEGLWLSAAAGARIDPGTRDRLALPDATVGHPTQP